MRQQGRRLDATAAPTEMWVHFGVEQHRAPSSALPVLWYRPLHGLMSLSMTCAGCGFELLADFAFCPRCGRRQPVACASCGFACEPDFAFCPALRIAARAGRGGTAHGRESRRRPPAGHRPLRRPLRFTSLSERLDPEEVRAFQGALFDSLGQAITRTGGFVAKYLGDAVLALFGAPVAHEDDPERALEAALDMLRRAAALSGTWAARLGQPVSLHIAVHTGVTRRRQTR